MVGLLYTAQLLQLSAVLVLGPKGCPRAAFFRQRKTSSGEGMVYADARPVTFVLEVTVLACHHFIHST